HAAAMRIGVACLGALIAAILLYPHLPAATRYVPVSAGVLASLPFVFALTRDNATDRWLGELSYPVYLLHVPVLHYVSGTLAVVATTFATAVLVHVLVQTSVERAFKAERQPGRPAGHGRDRRGLGRPLFRKPSSMLSPCGIEAQRTQAQWLPASTSRP